MDSILFKMLRSFVTKNKLIFALFCICQAVSIISIIFVYGMLVAREDYNNTYGLRNRQFTVSADSSLTLDTIWQMAENLDSDSRIKDGIENYTLLFNTDGYEISSNLKYKEPSTHYVSFGKYFSPKDFKQDNSVVIINSVLANYEKYYTDSFDKPTYKVGDQITFQGKSYTICGITSQQIGKLNEAIGIIEIPFPSLVSLDGLQSIAITLPKNVNSDTAQAYADVIKEVWHIDNISLPLVQSRKSVQDNLFQMLSSLAIALLAALNFSSLYGFILKRRQFEYSIFRMYGCTKSKGFYLFLGELLIVGSGVFILSSIGFHFGLSWIYPYMKDGVHYALTLKDYFDIYCIYTCILLLVFIPIIIKYSKKSPSEIYRTA